MKSYILKYSAIVLAGLLTQWWLFLFAPFAIPEHVPGTNLKTEGLVLITFIVVIMYFFQKGLLKSHPGRGILSLSYLGTLMYFLAETVFQAIRMPTLAADSISEKLYYFVYGAAGMTLFAALFSFLVAFQLKKKSVGFLILLVLGLLFAFYLLRVFFPDMAKA